LVEQTEHIRKFPEPVRPLDPDRVRQIAGMLDCETGFPGRPIGDREAWNELGRTESFRRLPSEAEALLREPLAQLTEDIYFDHVRTGTEKVYGHYNRTTRGRFTKLVLAECVEDKGRFLPAIHESIAAVCAEPTWVHAYHDTKLRNWRGETIEIDLSSSTMGSRLAVADRFLGDRLDDGARAAIRAEVGRRILEPFEAMLKGQRICINQDGPFTWMELTHNWNAVCLANLVGTTLALVESEAARARCVAAAERYIRNFLSGFGTDGACLEGMNYWNFGFSHFLMLGETIWHATGGRIDLLEDEQVKQIARFGARMQIVPGVCPAFADCQPDVSPLPDVMRFVSRRFGLGLTPWEATEPEASSLPFVANFAFANSATRVPARDEVDADLGLRSWFEDAGLYVGRPGPGGGAVMGVAFKGGCNAEHHNHNDLGSFVVASRGRVLLTDPGSEHYTSRTFGPNRYDSNVLNSYGHPVPRVAGRLQRDGFEARAPVKIIKFDDEQDLVVYDLRRGYDVPGLKKLERTFLFSRRGGGCLTVTDEVRFAQPQDFEVALITFDTWRQVAPDRLIVCDDGNALRVDLRVEGGAFGISAEQIEEEVRAPTRPTRIAIALKDAVIHAIMEVSIAPMDG
jgi:hypothetical protein